MSNWDCQACGENTTDILDHIRVFHPEWEPERWPDGGLVIWDDTLEEEFLA